jgi:hypothetical protein
MRAVAWFTVLVSLSLPSWARQRNCATPETVSKYLNKDTCVMAHVYDVVELSDGTRFLDLCSPSTSDEACRFSIVSLKEDRKEVGDLTRYRNQDIQIRGVVRPFNYRMEITLSHERQFHGGSEKFRPNPVLLKGFTSEDHKTAFKDSALSSNPHSSSFTHR